jgi:hypothetical protein
MTMPVQTVSGGAAPDWSSALAEGEHLLWQGRPAPGLTLTRDGIVRLVVAVFFLFNGWLWLRYGMWMGFAFLAAALWLVAEVTVIPLLRQRATAYALTNRRALILTRWPLLTPRLRGWPITPDTIVTADESRPHGHVSFGFAPLFLSRMRVRTVGFDRIPDAAAVHALIRRIQKGQDLPERPSP